MTTLSPVRSDTLPEHTLYRDEGCELASACLNCPLPVCKYDDPEWVRRRKTLSRDSAVIEARHVKRLSVPAIARRFGVSTRTVHRILSASRACDPRELKPMTPKPQLAATRFFKTPLPLPAIRPWTGSEQSGMRLIA